MFVLLYEIRNKLKRIFITNKKNLKIFSRRCPVKDNQLFT